MPTPTPDGSDRDEVPGRRRRQATAILVVALLLLVLATASPGRPLGWIVVDESAELFDGPLHVRVVGVRPGQAVTINASATDIDGQPWQSTATFVAGPGGTVEVASTAPVGGSYRVASATGLLWSLAPSRARLSYYFTPAATTYPVTLALVVRATVVAQTTIERRIVADGVRGQVLSVARDGMDAMLYEPADTSRRRPAVLVFGGSEGGLSVGDQAAALASHGYPALALAYFGDDDLPPTLANIPLEYFATALRWLAGQPGVDPGRMVVLGISRGSEAALLLGVHYPELVHAVIAAVPSSTAFGGVPDITQPAWTRQGSPVPFATPDREYRTGIPAAAVIPVERIRGPIFLVCGELDQLWPSCRFTGEITNRLRANDFGYPVVALVEPEAGHAVGSLLPNRASSSGFEASPRYGRLIIGGTQSDDALGRLDAWTRLLAFLAGQ